MPKTLLLTGATDGIGLALARRLQRRSAVPTAGAFKAHEVATANSTTWSPLFLGRKSPTAVDPVLLAGDRYLPVDFTNVNFVAPICEALASRGIDRLEALVHNAAIGWYGALEDQPPSAIVDLVAVNVRAPIQLTRALAEPILRARGHVVFVSSIVADLPCPEYAVYAATKAALDSFARNLRFEWKGRAKVSVAHLGATRTGMHAKAGVPETLLAGRPLASADAVAATLERLLERPRNHVAYGWSNRVLRRLARSSPRAIEWLWRRRR